MRDDDTGSGGGSCKVSEGSSNRRRRIEITEIMSLKGLTDMLANMFVAGRVGLFEIVPHERRKRQSFGRMGLSLSSTTFRV